MTIAAGAMTVIATGNSLEVPRRSRRVFALGRAKSIHKALADRESAQLTFTEMPGASGAPQKS